MEVADCFLLHFKTTQAHFDFKVTIFTQTPHLMIPAEVSTQMYVKIFNASNVDRVFTLEK